MPSLPLRLLARLLRRLPVKGGLGRVSEHPWVRASASRCTEQIHARLRNGMSMTVDMSDFNGRQIYLFGTAEPKVVEACSYLLRPGDVFCDVGANHGIVGLSCADAVAPQGEVHLFEPQPDICRRIRRAISHATLTHVHLHAVALMDYDGRQQLLRPSNHTGAARLLDDHEHAPDNLTVPVRDVAAALPPLVKDRPFAVKLDVEGAESVLLPWLMRQANLRFVVFESFRIGDPSLFDEFTDRGFALFGLARSIFRVRLAAIRSGGACQGYHDVIAIRCRRPDHLPATLSLRQLRRWADDPPPAR